MASSSTGEIIKWGLLGLAGWWVYKNFLTDIVPATAGTPATPKTPATPDAAAPKAPVDPFTASSSNSLEKVYKALSDRAGAGSMLTADEWNWYLMQVVPGFTAPDPMGVFSTLNFDPPWHRDTKLVLGAYWLPISQVLVHEHGLSGVNHFARLAGLYGFGGAN